MAIAFRRHELPQAVMAITPRRAARVAHPVPRLSHATDRCTRVGPWQARCLVTALVLYRLLRSQGDAAELVIGLAPAARDHLAHAWVEVDGRVVGPPPGRAGHRELVRYPA